MEMRGISLKEEKKKGTEKCVDTLILRSRCCLSSHLQSFLFGFLFVCEKNIVIIWKIGKVSDDLALQIQVNNVGFSVNHLTELYCKHRHSPVCFELDLHFRPFLFEHRLLSSSIADFVQNRNKVFAMKFHAENTRTHPHKPRTSCHVYIMTEAPKLCSLCFSDFFFVFFSIFYASFDLNG